jgi:hypothetical protein
MKWDDVFCNTFKAISQRHAATIKQQVDFLLPSMAMVNACRVNDFEGFGPFIAAGKLTTEQMHHATQRYHLGKTKSGQPIFWMIDDIMTPLDAHIGEGWISELLKRRDPILDFWHVKHCLFGLHLLSGTVPSAQSISIVESEASAIVLSELFPESLWLAYSTTSHLYPELLAPLEGQTVTIYPRTDPTMSTYLFFLDYAEAVRQSYDIDLTIDATLEDHATESQKERCIDLLDFLLDSLQ